MSATSKILPQIPDSAKRPRPSDDISRHPSALDACPRFPKIDAAVLVCYPKLSSERWSRMGCSD